MNRTAPIGRHDGASFVTVGSHARVPRQVTSEIDGPLATALSGPCRRNMTGADASRHRGTHMDSLTDFADGATAQDLYDDRYRAVPSRCGVNVVVRDTTEAPVFLPTSGGVRRPPLMPCSFRQGSVYSVRRTSAVYVARMDMGACRSPLAPFLGRSVQGERRARHRAYAISCRDHEAARYRQMRPARFV